jgi:outer membrane receptor for ferrienterochelin and colicins
MKWKPKRQYSVDGSYLYSHNDYKLRFTSQYFNEKLWNKGNVIQPVYALDTYFYTRRFTNTLDVSTKIGNSRYLGFIAAYSIYDRIRDSFFKNLHTLENNPMGGDTTKFNAITFRPVISKSKEESKLNYQFGLDFNVENGSGVKITDNKQQIGDYAGFLSLNYAPVPSFTMQPGIRVIYNTKYNAPLVYSLNLQWNMREYYNIRASYARGFRAPSLKELYLYFVDVNHNIQGNDQLKAEDSHNVNLSFDFNREANKVFYGFEIDFFYNKINNLITLAQVNQTAYTYINVDHYASHGFQSELKYNLYPYLTWKAGVIFTGRKNDLEDDNIETKQYFYTTDANTSLTYSIIKISMDLSLFYKYTGRTPQYVVVEENLVESYIPDYHTMDISAIKYFFNRRFQVSAGIKNLFDNTALPAIGSNGNTAHSGGGTLIGWGRTFFVRAAYTFKKF